MPTRVLVRAGMKLSVLGRRLLATKKYCPLLLLLGVFCQVSALPQSPNSELQRLSQLVQQRYQAGDLDGAITNYQRAVKLDPQSETAYSGLDAALLGKGDFKELAAALALLEKPKATLPGSMQLSRLRRSRGRFPASHCALPDGPESSHQSRTGARKRSHAAEARQAFAEAEKAQGHLEAPGHATLTHPRDRSFSFRGQCPTLGVWHGHHVPLRCRDSV